MVVCSVHPILTAWLLVNPDSKVAALAFRLAHRPTIFFGMGQVGNPGGDPDVTRAPRRTDTFRWRLAIGAVLIAGGYAAWPIIPLVVASDLSPSIKAALTAVLGATPLLTKLLAIALLGRPTIEFLKKHSFKLLPERFRRR
jgi:hypothetical protein